MRAADPSTLRSVRLRAALLVLVGGMSIAACGSSPAAPVDAVQAALEALDNTPCNGVILDARHAYRPASWSDGHVSFAAGALTFTVPEFIPVTEGQADQGRAELSFANHDAPATTCVYVGDGAAAYLFRKCRHGGDMRPHRNDDVEDSDGEDPDREGRPDALPGAGSIAVANEFTLHVERGLRSAGTTAVRVALPGPVIDDRNECTADSCDAIAGVSHTPIDSGFCRGKANFHDRTLHGLGGNGRSCADCHMPAENFQLTPAAAKARFVQITNSGIDDPLFRAIDADDFRVNGAAAHDFTNLTENGLVRVTIPLPANVKLLDCGATVPCPPSAVPTGETVADVWRSVPSIFDVAITGPDGAAPAYARGPNQRGGYQLDARIDTLQNQALAALRAHASVAVDPPASFLDDVATFEQTLFSSASVKLLSEAMSASLSPLPDPDPVLDELETAGKAVFNRSCAQCHGNMGGHPGTSTPILQGTPGTPTALVRYHDILTACPRPVDTANPPRFSFAACSPSQMRNVRTYEITNSGIAPGGTPCGGAPPQPACVTRVTTSDPGRLLLTGFPAAGGPGDIQHMDIPNLRGISRTAPYFSNNTAATLEEMIEHYKQFFKRVQIQAPAAPLLTTQPGVVPPVIDRPFTDAEVPALLAYLRKI
jgi:cytochrome c peroxidase